MVNVSAHMDLFMLINTTNLIKISHKVCHIIIMLFFNDVVIVKWEKKSCSNFSFKKFHDEKTDKRYNYHDSNYYS